MVLENVDIAAAKIAALKRYLLNQISWTYYLYDTYAAGVFEINLCSCKVQGDLGMVFVQLTMSAENIYVLWQSLFCMILAYFLL